MTAFARAASAALGGSTHLCSGQPLLPVRPTHQRLTVPVTARCREGLRHPHFWCRPSIGARVVPSSPKGDGNWESDNSLRVPPATQLGDNKPCRKRVSTSASSEYTLAMPRQPRSSFDTAPALRPPTSSMMAGAAAGALQPPMHMASHMGGSNPDASSNPSTEGSGSSPDQKGPDSDQSWKWLVALCTLSVVICYADRSNISTAVLPMAEQFGWDKAYQGVVLSTFFGGYALTQILGGQLADKLGGKLVLAAGVALWSVFTFITPSAAAAGTIPLLASRVMLGVGEGVAFPSIHSLIARNVPYENQSTAVGIVTAASDAGTALAFGISPLIISQLGWQWVFYIFSAFALLWLPLWLPISTKDMVSKGQAPAEAHSSGSSNSSSSGSLQQISTSDESAALLERRSSGSEASSSELAAGGKGALMKMDAGFWALMRRKEVWAICAAQYCQSWGMYGLLNWLPTFFSEYYHVEIADLASYTLLPYIVQGGLGALTGVMADKMLQNGWNVRNVRIMLQVTGMVGPAACLLLAVSPLVGASPSLASNLITVGLGFSALTLGGVSVSHLDIAPRHAGVIFGAGNTAATLAGLISVPFTGFLLQTTGSWPLVFGITAAHYLLGAVLWSLWVGDKPLPEDNEGKEPVQITNRA